MAKRISRAARRANKLHSVLNDFLSLFWPDTKGLAIREMALDALALLPNRPITATFATDVRKRALDARPKRVRAALPPTPTETK